MSVAFARQENLLFKTPKALSISSCDVVSIVTVFLCRLWILYWGKKEWLRGIPSLSKKTPSVDHSPFPCTVAKNVAIMSTVWPSSNNFIKLHLRSTYCLNIDWELCALWLFFFLYLISCHMFMRSVITISFLSFNELHAVWQSFWIELKSLRK